MERAGSLSNTCGRSTCETPPDRRRRGRAQPTDLSEWFADTDNAAEVTDRTGQSEVTVYVGTDGNEERTFDAEGRLCTRNGEHP
ncbi:hypothetical protein BRC67_10540, partial [Halobacteriales archaeon QH_3_68_24]